MLASRQLGLRGSKQSIAMGSDDAVKFRKFGAGEPWIILPWEPADSIRLLGGAAGARMLVHTSQEAVPLIIKGVGLAVPDFASAAQTLLRTTRALLPLAHLLHPTVIALTRKSKGLAPARVCLAIKKPPCMRISCRIDRSYIGISCRIYGSNISNMKNLGWFPSFQSNGGTRGTPSSLDGMEHPIYKWMITRGAHPKA